MTEHYGLILDGLVVVLLVATIIYAAILNRRLSSLRDNRAELERAARTFSEAAGRADAGLKALKTTAEATGGNLQKDIDRARALKDELGFLVESAEALAQRLELAASVGRAGPAPEAAAPAPTAPASEATERPAEEIPRRTRA
ncbi:MAG: DUF6468 domain-containing protein, partial [Azospirillaceae bacterium]